VLNALSTSIGDIISLFLQTLRFAALLPAFCFVVVNQFIFFRPLYLDAQARESLELFQQPLLWTIAVTIVLGYTLSALNVPIIRLFEGYPFRFTWWGGALTEKQSEKKRKMQLRKNFYLKFYQVSKDILSSRYSDIELNARLYSRMSAKVGDIDYELRNHFPGEESAILPTRLGNSIAAFEEYPQRRYGIDAIELWSHLLPILSDKQYSIFVEREKATLDFMLNMALLTSILAFEGIISRLCGYQISMWLVLAFAAAAFFFYRGAIDSALGWGGTVKVAFDLYRYDLANQLALRSVWSFPREKDQWRNLSDFLQDPDEERPIKEQVNYDYPLPKKAKADG
jgi:hypothetical protein